MAKQPDIQYIHYYTDGSAARILEPAPKKKKVTLPKPKVRKVKRKVIYVDPISLLAMVVAGFMLVTMAVGMIQLGAAREQTAAIEAYAASLRAESVQLQAEYKSQIDLEDVERKALGMGLVPMDQVQHVTIQVAPPVVEETPSAWEEFWAFVTELFA